MDKVTGLKENRSRLKRDVNLASSKISTALKRNQPISTVHRQLEVLDSVFNEFHLAHLEYADLLDEDSSFEQHRIVNGLGLDDYYDKVKDSVEQTYDAILSYENSLYGSKVKDLECAVNRSLDQIGFFMGQLDSLVADCDSSRADVYIGEADKVVVEVNELITELRSISGKVSHDCKELVDNAELSIVQITRKIVEAKALAMTRVNSANTGSNTQSPPVPNHSPIHVSASTPNPHSHPSQVSDLVSSDERAHIQSPPPATQVSNADGNHDAPALLEQSLISVKTVGSSVTDAYIRPATQQVGTNAPNGFQSGGQVTKSDNMSNSTQIQGQLMRPIGESHFTRAPPPTFNGNRTQWAEFRSVWKLYGARAFSSEEDKAWALKQCLKGEALEHVKAIYCNQPQAYERLWNRLDSIYSDISMSVQQVYEDFDKIKPVSDNDMKALIVFINSVESCYSQLGEVSQLACVTMNHIDELCDRLPLSMRKDWMKNYRSLTQQERIHPFTPFMLFLESEREDALRLSERQTRAKSVRPDRKPNYNAKQVHTQPNYNAKQAHTHSAAAESPSSNCLVHTNPGVKHQTEKCNSFIKMPVNERKSLLMKKKACFRCFGTSHKRSDCESSAICSKCQYSHHELLCNMQQGAKEPAANYVNHKPAPSENKTNQTAATHHVHASKFNTLFAIQSARVIGSDKTATVFFDNGSNTSYITNKAAKRLGARVVCNKPLQVLSMGNVATEYDTKVYCMQLESMDHSIVKVFAYGIKEITGPVSQIDMQTVGKLFPHCRNIEQLQRQSNEVDMLIGGDYLGLHPKQEKARAGPHLSIMEGPFGLCLQGYHPKLKENTNVVTNLGTASTFLSRSREAVLNTFITGEELGTETVPKCGGCRCGKCPIPGHSYSFKEQQELNLIRDNLTYDKKNQAWVAKYPWLVEPHTLPNNYSSVYATLANTEKVLHKKSVNWTQTYGEQIQDMVNRGVARKLTTEEVNAWSGPTFYISHLAVQNPKSTSTPVRIVFNSSQKHGGVSLNEVLAKGPDCYVNNLLGIVLRWREKPAVLIGDIRKMFNSIHISEVDQHCHRFLWRNMETSRSPDSYVITRVNMGDRPAPAISTEAIIKTAEMMAEPYPRVAELLKTSIYVDDIVESVGTKEEAIELAKDTEVVLKQGGFTIKGWQFNGGQSSDPQNSAIRVLGIKWSPQKDTVSFEVSLNFSGKSRGTHKEPNLLLKNIPESIPQVLTRRLVLEQIMRIFDPLGILSPFIVIAKALLRKTWELKLGWDDALPDTLHQKWVTYLQDMYLLEDVEYDRCLKPAEAIGEPVLILLSDASETAYGFAAYIRWELGSGDYWSRLILAKSRIAPLHRISTPQLELNGAVLAKRGREVIEREMRYSFKKVYHLIDSQTVLCMLNKLSTRFKIYEGVRVGEIQAYTKGDMSDWLWIKGADNCSDWVTRGKSPDTLGPSSEWWTGPKFLKLSEDEWGTKSLQDVGQTDALLPGEKKVANTHIAVEVDALVVDVSRFSSAKKLLWVIARLKAVGRLKSFRGGATVNVQVQDLRASSEFLVKMVQRVALDSQNMDKGRYKNLQPVKDGYEVWRVGSRLEAHNPMARSTNGMLALMPLDHPYTKLLMQQAHVTSGHRGRDATLARFRTQYWTPQGSKLAKAIANSCQLCKLRKPKLADQCMGQLPAERLTPSLPFTNVMVDFFGPYLIKGEVQKRTTGKAYGVIFTDLVSRAVHIEPCFGYDTSSFMLALRRFTSVRGWPKVIFSDPGSQLVHTSKELQTIWKSVERERLFKCSTDNGARWVFGPADSPWRQGAVEALVKSTKHCFKFAFNSQRLTASEFITVCYEAANVLNERPLGLLPDIESEIKVLTPNCLLLGRSVASVLDSSQIDVSGQKTRMGLVNFVSGKFWQKWTELYAPTLVRQNKWTHKYRDFKAGDVVLVCDSNALRSQYHIAEVKETYPDKTGTVRKVLLRYKNHKVGSNIRKYVGAPDVLVSRSIQRLALLVPVDTP